MKDHFVLRSTFGSISDLSVFRYRNFEHVCPCLLYTSIPARRVMKREELQDAIHEMLANDGPFLLEACVIEEGLSLIHIFTMMCLFQINKDCRVKRKEDTDYEKEKHSEDCTL